jgi:4-amino-4-deoxy-L-arabinose transferase-like glycosyltransferase
MKDRPQTRTLLTSSRRETWILAILILVSLVLRTALVRIDRVVRYDEPDYLILGRNLFSGRGYAVTDRAELHYAPLFPVVTGLLYPLTRNMKLNSDIAYVLFGTLTLLPFYGLAKRLFDTRTAVIATTWLCLYPMLTSAVLFWGTLLEPLYLFLVFSALYATWVAWEDKQPLAYLAAGGLLGLAYLTKPEAIAYMGLLLALAVVANLWRRTLLQPRTMLGIVGSVLAFALVISPYIAFLYQQTGRIMITGKLGVTYVAGEGAVVNDPGLYDRALSELDEAGEEIIWFSMDRFKYDLWDIIRADPARFVYRTWRNINRLESTLFSRQVFPLYLLMLVGIGWFGSPWNREQTVKELFLIAAVLPVLVFLPFHIELRYFATALPILWLWVVRGLDALAEWANQTLANLGVAARRRSGVSTALVASVTVLMVLFFLAVQPQVVQEGLSRMGTSRRDAGLWLKENSGVDVLVMSRDTEVPFYAQRRWAATPHEDYQTFIAYVQKRRADYVVVDEREATVIRPQLKSLLDEASPPPELRHAYTASDDRGKTIVYEVLY